MATEIRKIENVTPKGLAILIESFASKKYKGHFSGEEYGFNKEDLVNAAREAIEVCRIHCSIAPINTTI